MNPRTLIVGCLALGCGLAAMFLVRNLRPGGSGPAVERVPVVFVAADVHAGDAVEEAMLEVRQVVPEEVPEDAIHKIADAAGRAALGPLDKGDLVRDKKLAARGAGRGMAALIRPGMRAFTIQTPSFSSSLAGLLLPGDRVDVLLTTVSNGGAEDRTGGGTVSTLLQNVEVLAVHTTTTVNAPAAKKVDPSDARSVTLQVTPEDVESLDLGQNRGTLHLALRNAKEAVGAKPKPTTMADLLPGSALAPAAVPAAVPAPPPEPEPEPEPEPAPPRPTYATVTIRTLRGTAAGQDLLTIIQPPAATPTRPASPGRTARASGSRLGDREVD